jgi:hypothetical protein
MIIAVVMINFSKTTFYGIGLLSIVCIYVVFIKVKINTKQWTLDKSLYDVPLEEDILITSRKFYWDGSQDSYHIKKFTNKSHVVFIEKGTELKIIHLKERVDDWSLMLKKGNGEIIISVNYLESKKYFKTKAQVREDKLKKLLK